MADEELSILVSGKWRRAEGVIASLVSEFLEIDAFVDGRPGSAMMREMENFGRWRSILARLERAKDMSGFVLKIFINKRIREIRIPR